MENILTASDPKHPKKRVTFKDETHPFDPDQNHESVGMEESRTTPSNEDPRDTHEKEEMDDVPGENNFSTRESFELDDLLENNGAKLEAIPVDMLRTEDTGVIFPDLQHLSDPTRGRVLQILKDSKICFKLW
jgi:hypothetical protein